VYEIVRVLLGGAEALRKERSACTPDLRLIDRNHALEIIPAQLPRT
jgi:hypothetical protein